MLILRHVAWRDGVADIESEILEYMLKLSTRAKFHLGTAHLMEMIIALNTSFRKDQN